MSMLIQTNGLSQTKVQRIGALIMESDAQIRELIRLDLWCEIEQLYN